MKTKELLELNLTDFLEEIKQDIMNLKYKLEFADLKIISGIDIHNFLQRITNNFDLNNMITVYKDIDRWEYCICRERDETPFITKQIKQALVEQVYNYIFYKTIDREGLRDTDIEKLKCIAISIESQNEMLNALIDGHNDAIQEFNNNYTDTKAKHFTRSFSTDEAKRLYEGLTNNGYLPKGTIYGHFYHVFGRTAISDNEKPFKPLVWQQTIGLLAYLIDNLFADTDGTNLWEITAQCFVYKDKAPNKNSLKNTVSKYKQESKNKPKGYKDLDTILNSL
jgi:hypothetical protein